MYINKIDDLIDKIIDDFYNYIFKVKEFIKITKESNFVKYQLDINNILSDYTKTINRNDVAKIVENEDNVIKVLDIIKRYLAYYLFLTIGYFYDGKRETFINNVVEFSKNQSTFNYKINNFFNAENNSILIKFFEIVKNTMLVLTLEPSKLQIAIAKPEFKSTIEFLNTLGQEFVIANFKLENLSGKKEEQSHNIIKTIILNELYYKIEKKDVHDILLLAEKKEGIFTFIDVVIPNALYVDFNSIEGILNPNEIKRGYANEIYDFIMSNEYKLKSDELSTDEKIINLINNHIFIPVTDEFLLYHKDNEKYEKVQQNTDNKYKKKEDTKIRYIVSKIDNVSELYSESVQKNSEVKKNILKQFYTPLIDRKAILVNNNEEIKIINKLHNQGRRSIENNEYYNDLMNYRQYPYINFKEFQDYGFPITATKTIDVVRYTSFDKNTKSKDTLQMRIGSKDQILNVVGLLVPTTTMPVECIPVNKVTNAKDIKTNNKTETNAYKTTIKYLKNIMEKKMKHKSSLFWKFNPKTDTIQMPEYNQVSKLTPQEDLKLVISRLYDDLMVNLYGLIANKLDKKKEIAFYDAFNMIKYHEKLIFNIPKEDKFYNMIEKMIFYQKYEKSEKKYDTKEDEFSGLFGEIIKLPSYEPKKDRNVHTIKIKQDFIIDTVVPEKTEAEKVGAICQHFVTWDNIVSIKKKSPTDYGNMLYDFINQYVMENNDQDYVCKSCGTQLNIKKYVTDGVYDKDTDRFMTFNMPMEIPLEEIPEYEKYKTAIRIIDKQLENIASIASLPFYVGSSTTIKSRRKGIVKSVLDILMIHNKNMAKVYKERHEKIDKIYGISKDLTNMFVFELDNSIFVYSSKDKDFYKPIKHNNIIIYMMLLLILDINKSQIIYMNSDKTCNFYWFEKYGHYMFENLKLVINDNGDTVPIKNFKILCYLIFYLACLVTKYNMWYFETEEKEKMPKKKLIPIINKVIVNTFVDITNSILEINKNKDKHYIYTMMSNRFFLQLHNLYKDADLVTTLKQTDGDKMSALLDNKKYIVAKFKPIILEGEYIFFDTESHKYKTCNVARYILKKRTHIPIHYFNVNGVTNCINGKFHKWEPVKKTLVCEICNITIDDAKIDKKDTDIILENMKYMRLQKLAEQFCSSGETHSFEYNAEKQYSVCKKCKVKSTTKFTREELDKIDENMNKLKLVKESKMDKVEESNEIKKIKYDKYSDHVLSNLEKEYNASIKDSNAFTHIDKFINLVQTTIGTDVNINNENIFIKDDAYIINHNHNGQPYDTPIIITDKSKIIYKKNDSFFNTDVIYYTNNKSGKIDVFYDANTFILLGYKELNKDYTRLPKTDKYMLISYSLESRIKLLGYSQKYINIKEQLDEYKQYYIGSSTEFIINNIVADINRTRIVRLKRIITDIQRYIYRIIFNYEEKIDENEANKNFMTKYYKKLNNLNIKDGDDKIFSDWEVIQNDVFMKNINDTVINISADDKYISIDELSKYDHSGNLILFYIIREISKLIQYNNNKFVKATVVYLLIDIINKTFEIYNNDVLLKNNDIKRFTYIIKSNRFIHDIEQKGHGLEGETEGFYGEYKDEDEKDDEKAKEQLEDDIEEQEALDVDTEIDYEDMIERYTF